MNSRYHDSVARRARRRRMLSWAGWGLAGAVVVSGSVAALYFSPLVRITSIDVTGVISIPEEEAVEIVSHANRVPSLFNFDADQARAQLMASFPQIREAVITKQWPHRVKVAITERPPRGVWCRPSEPECQFWDDSGARWGHIAPSIGPLLLQVRDERAQENGEGKILTAILAVVDGVTPLGLRVRAVILPDAEPGGARITLMSGYDLLVDLHGDVDDQLSTLEVFLADRAKDPGFKPSYIDLRTPGRIYYHLRQ